MNPRAVLSTWLSCDANLPRCRSTATTSAGSARATRVATVGEAACWCSLRAGSGEVREEEEEEVEEEEEEEGSE